MIKIVILDQSRPILLILKIKKFKIQKSKICKRNLFFVFVSLSEQLWLFNGQVNDSTQGDFYFHPLNGSEHGPHPSLTTRDRGLVSVLEVRIEPGDLNLKPLTPQSVTVPTLPRACTFIIRENKNKTSIQHFLK